MSRGEGAGSWQPPVAPLQFGQGDALTIACEPVRLQKYDNGDWCSFRFGEHDVVPRILPIKMRINLLAADYARFAKPIRDFLTKGGDYEAFSRSSCSIVERFKCPTPILYDLWMDGIKVCEFDAEIMAAAAKRFKDDSEFTLYVARGASLADLKALRDDLQAFLTELGCAESKPFFADTELSANLSMRCDGGHIGAYTHVLDLAADSELRDMTQQVMRATVWSQALVEDKVVDEEHAERYAPLLNAMWRLIYEISRAESDPQKELLKSFLPLLMALQQRYQQRLSHRLFDSSRLNESMSIMLLAYAKAVREGHVSDGLEYSMLEAIDCLGRALPERCLCDFDVDRRPERPGGVSPKA